MPKSPCVDIPEEEQAWMLAARRRARYGSLRALHILRRCADGRHPTEIALVLCCSRSRVYRAVWASQKGTLILEPDDHGRRTLPVRTTVLVPPLRRSRLALLKATPHAYGGCRTRGSGAALALTWQTTRGVTVSAETMRRWRHEIGWVWKRATLVAKADDPQRVTRLARSRSRVEPLRLDEVLVCADARDLHLWPKVGGAWRPTGAPLAVMTPGQHQQHSLAGALEVSPGRLHHGLGPRKTHGLCRALWQTLEDAYPAAQSQRVSGVVDHEKIHQAKAVEAWLANHPRLPRLLWPPYGPRATPIDRAYGDVHDGCTRHHRRTRVPDRVADVEDPRQLNGPWQYKRSDLDDEPAVTATVENIAAEELAKVAA